MVFACSYARENVNSSLNISNNSSFIQNNYFIDSSKKVIDIDKNVYNVVLIGRQYWMKENLKTTHYRNGKSILTNLSDLNWLSTTNGAYSIYNDSSKYDFCYGKLYNWYSVANENGLCPLGWHVPKDWEWNELIKTIDSLSDTVNIDCVTCIQSLTAGSALKAIEICDGVESNNSKINSDSFCGVLGGHRYKDLGYSYMGLYGGYWSSSQASNTKAYLRLLSYSDSSIVKGSDIKSAGFSVRCIKD
jgi:uncharacterized protein (TIGR02145 family)